MKKKYLILLAFVTFQTMLQAQTVTIGTQIWSIANLNVDTYSDGTNIPQVTDPTAWKNLTTGAWCYYNNDPANGAIYGKLYNWYAVVGIYDAASLANPSLRKSIAPSGVHVPTDAEWTTLTTYLGGENIAGDAMKETGTSHWLSSNTNSTNSSGFTAFPGGCHLVSGYFGGVGIVGYWWSFSEIDADYAFFLSLSYNNSLVMNSVNDKRVGYSVRCLSNQLAVQQQTISKIAIYPNPTSSILTLQTSNNTLLDKITITDLTGKVVLTQTTNTTHVNVASLACGVYIIEAVSGQEKFVSKFVKE